MASPCCVTTVTCLSALPLSEQCAIVFDLDDTLYAERDFVRSGFRAIADRFDSLGHREQVFQLLETGFDQGARDGFEMVMQRFPSVVDKPTMLDIYRSHVPEISLSREVRRLLDALKSAGRPLGLLTDGRSTTQRNKIVALGLEKWFDEIVISAEFGSEKPDPRNYQHFEQSLAASEFAYVGDNLKKDFIAPNRLGWTTIGLLDRGQNIHRQAIDDTPPQSLPQYFIESIA